MKTNSTKGRNLLCIVLTVCIALALSVSAFAANVNEAVKNDENGVLEVFVVYTTEDGEELYVQGGSGFLINDTTLVTCDHLATVSSDTVKKIAESMETTVANANSRLSIRVSVLRDVNVKAKIQYHSAEMDYAILTLDTPIYNRTPLELRSSSEVQKTETCYALGFPAEIEYLQSVNKYNSEDVSITSGQVNKISNISGVNYVQHSAKTMEGNSGGPVVDDNGFVIGISSMVSTEESYSYAIASDELIEICKSLGIEYSSVDGGNTPATGETEPESEPTKAVDKTALQNAINNASGINGEDYSEETATALATALDNANAVNNKADATQAEVDSAVNALNAALDDLEVKAGLPLIAIVGIAVAVVAAVVAVILILTKKNKSVKPVAPVAAPVAPVAPQPVGAGKSAPAPFTVNPGGMNTTVLNQGAGETTVLNQGSNETTVLSQNKNFGSLVRSKNKETIIINKENFRIGKERSNVDYCVSNNTAVSRVHVAIVSRGGKTYAADQRSLNGTFVNDVRVDAGKEVELKKGDKLTLADEDFVFNI